jgi:membrane protein DedA with SNARE-associated domain
MTLNPAIAPLLVRTYLWVATLGAIIAVPGLVMFGWWASSSVKSSAPPDWVSWTVYVAIGAAIVIGPVLGWRLQKRGKPIAAMGVSLFAFLLAPLLIAGMLSG